MTDSGILVAQRAVGFALFPTQPLEFLIGNNLVIYSSQ